MIENTLQQLKNMLIPLKIYGDIAETMIECELKAYASGLNLVKERTYFLLQEAFVATASSMGIREYEELLGLVDTGTLEERKEKIIYKLSSIRGKWEVEDFCAAIFVPGFNGGFTEDPANRTLEIGFNNKNQATFEMLSKTFSRVEGIMPTHLKVCSNLPEKTFDEYDLLDKRFISYDKLNLTFDLVEES